MIDRAQSQPKGAWEARRKIHIPGLGHEAAGATVERALAGIDGVLRVSAHPDKGWVRVDYLMTKTDYRALELAAKTVGCPPATGYWAHLRSAWYQNLDLTGRENAGVPAAACCSRPPVKGHRNPSH